MTPAIKAARKARVEFNVHRYEHERGAPAYGEEAAQALGLPPERVFKTLVVDLGNALGVALVPVARRLDLKRCANHFGVKRLELADPAHAQRTTGYVVGGISPLGQKRRLRTVLDTSARTHRTVFVSAGRRGMEIELSPGDLATLTGAEFAEIASA